MFAAGDVTDVPQYVYVAARTGKIAAHNALGHDERVDYTGLPSVLFTSPQLASAGSPKPAPSPPDTGAPADSTTFRRAQGHRQPRHRGGIKVVADADTGKVLGIHALADTAGEMMLACNLRHHRRIHRHPTRRHLGPLLTMAEGIRLTANLFRNELPTSCCA